VAIIQLAVDKFTGMGRRSSLSPGQARRGYNSLWKRMKAQSHHYWLADDLGNESSARGRPWVTIPSWRQSANWCTRFSGRRLPAAHMRKFTLAYYTQGRPQEVNRLHNPTQRGQCLGKTAVTSSQRTCNRSMGANYLRGRVGDWRGSP